MMVIDGPCVGEIPRGPRHTPLPLWFLGYQRRMWPGSYDIDHDEVANNDDGFEQVGHDGRELSTRSICP